MAIRKIQLGDRVWVMRHNLPDEIVVGRITTVEEVGEKDYVSYEAKPAPMKAYMDWFQMFPSTAFRTRSALLKSL